MDIDADGFCSLMDPENSETKDDIRIPDGELGDQIRAAFEKDDCGMNVSSATKMPLPHRVTFQLTVVAACGEEAILGFKNMPKDN